MLPPSDGGVIGVSIAKRDDLGNNAVERFNMLRHKKMGPALGPHFFIISG